MEPNDRLELTMRDLDRLRTINQVLEGRLTQVLAARRMALSDRQVRRLCARVRSAGPKGVVHGLRGTKSNNQLEPGLLERALTLVRANYSDFGPTFANEKLAQRHGVILSVPTLRQGMIDEGLWNPKHRRVKHRSWRARRACVGELIQLDGSLHRWFEDRGPACFLIAYIDDATSRLMHAEFVDAEDTLTLLRLTRDYLRRYGRPLAFYVDRDSIYKTTKAASVDEDLRDEQPMTQYTRAMSELDILVICANSPQAKGRVERGFRTHQDRLVKELRLARISEKAGANRYLREVYIPAHNARCAQRPAHPNNAHRPILRGQLLDRILCLRTQRSVYNDFTLRWATGFLQLLESQPVVIRPGHKVEVEVRLDGTVHLKGRGCYLDFKTIIKRPDTFKTAPSRPAVTRSPARLAPYKPATNHPWRQYARRLNPTTTGTTTQI
jgi:hypothetical protein